MSDLAMTVAIGPGHLNTGAPSHADVFGALYIGGSGAWRFEGLRSSAPADAKPLALMLDSQRNLIQEIRAGAALSLGLGSARDLAEKALGPNWATSRIELGKDVLEAIGNESRGMGVSFVITSLDAALLREVAPHVADAGWSTILCGVETEHLESQWNS